MGAAPGRALPAAAARGRPGKGTGKGKDGAAGRERDTGEQTDNRDMALLIPHCPLLKGHSAEDTKPGGAASEKAERPCKESLAMRAGQ